MIKHLTGLCLTAFLLTAPLGARDTASSAPAPATTVPTADVATFLDELSCEPAIAPVLGVHTPELRADRPVCCTAAKKQACASNCASQGCTGWTTSCATDICRCFCSGCP